MDRKVRIETLEKARATTRGLAMRTARLNAKLSLDELAEMTGLPKGTIWRLEVGRNNGNMVTTEILADALGLSLDEYTGHKIVKKGGENNE